MQRAQRKRSEDAEKALGCFYQLDFSLANISSRGYS
jgi:hypothetical protein